MCPYNLSSETFSLRGAWGMHNDRDWFTQLRRRALELVRDARPAHPLGVRDLARKFVKAIPAPQKGVQEALLGLTLMDSSATAAVKPSPA